MRHDLRLKQLGVTVVQRVVTRALMAAFKQELLFTGTQQRQVSHVAVEAVHQGQQQAFKFTQQTFNTAALKKALVIRQVQTQVIAGVTHRRQREVGVRTARVGGSIQVLRTVQYRHVHRRVFEHEQAVKQRLAFGQFAAFLNRHQRQVFVLAQFHVVFK